jgi:hypothetical protein
MLVKLPSGLTGTFSYLIGQATDFNQETLKKVLENWFLVKFDTICL